MPSNRVISIRKFIQKKRLGRRVTRQKKGLVYNRMCRTGRVCAVPISAPAELERPWLDPSDSRAPLARMAAAGETVPRSRIALVPPRGGSRIRALSEVGIAALPESDGMLRLQGTSPRLARIANQIVHGRRRRRLHRRELIEAVFGLQANGRATVVTDPRLEYALTYFYGQFGVDLSDLIDHDEVYIGCGKITF